MQVLAIESSCDETAAAVVRDDGLILADVVASQIDLHGPYGGVVPELASRAHVKAVVPVVQQAVAQLPGGYADIDAIAVTHGPGLMGALLVGVSAGKALAFARGLPLVGVNHLVGHLLAVYLRRDASAPPIDVPMPYVALLASGGHTALYRVDSPSDILMLGQTRDDAAGEAYDKVAKLLGLGYPGGPVIDKLAASGDPQAIAFPIPLNNKRSTEFSFSGLKTSVAQHLHKHGEPRDERALADLCASFQYAVVQSLTRKAVRACKLHGVHHLVLGGGVAANRGLRATAAAAAEKHGVKLHVPPISACTDNAAMIAYAGAQKLLAGARDGMDLGVFSQSPPFTSRFATSRETDD